MEVRAAVGAVDILLPAEDTALGQDIETVHKAAAVPAEGAAAEVLARRDLKQMGKEVSIFLRHVGEV